MEPAIGFRGITRKYLRGSMKKKDGPTNKLRRKAAALKSSASRWTGARKTPNLWPKAEGTG